MIIKTVLTLVNNHIWIFLCKYECSVIYGQIVINLYVENLNGLTKRKKPV